ncbi:MAG: hypothetical protein HY289_01265 [Planctomycetes bacterium]|nr:hypothetical protein [Planctomycetota bacterium]
MERAWDDFEAPRRKKAKQSGAGNWVLFGILGGSGLLALLLCCAGAGVGGYFLFLAGPPIAGKWEQTQPDPRIVQRDWEFYRGGTGKVRVQDRAFPGRVKDFTGHFTYKYTPGDPPTMEMTLVRVEGDAEDHIRREIGLPIRFRVHLDGDTMRLSNLDPRIRGDAGITLRRVR